MDLWDVLGIGGAIALLGLSLLVSVCKRPGQEPPKPRDQIGEIPEDTESRP